MDTLSRRVPWTLALLGGLHGWFAGLRGPRWRWEGSTWQPGESLPWLLGLLFSAGFFLGGWLYFRRPRHARGSILWAGAMILLCCTAVGCGLVVMAYAVWFPARGLELVLESAAHTFSVALPALPSAMLLVYAATHGATPREGSILAGTDRAEQALAIVSALVLLPWFFAPRPAEVAWLIVAMALPAMAIGLHAVTLMQRTTLIGHAFASASPCDAREPASLRCDVGVGWTWRALAFGPAPTYRGGVQATAALCHGCPEEGARAARRVVCWSLLVVSAAVVHALLCISQGTLAARALGL